jgi:uncharacterized protein YaaW (UPF0174 family)
MQQLEKLLNAVSQSERDNLAKILPQEVFSSSKSPATKDIIYALRWANDSSFMGTVVREQKSYVEILQTAAEHLKVNIPASEADEIKIEQLICQKLGQCLVEKMDKNQQAAWNAAIETDGLKYHDGAGFIASGGVAAALVAGNLGGFSTYMLASSGLAAASGVVGLTLPFAAYTGLSTALGVALGPVGWVGLGLAALFSIGGPSYDKLIQAILYIITLRNAPRKPATNADSLSLQSSERPHYEFR